MANRRAFIKTLAGLSAGALAGGAGLRDATAEAAQVALAPRRRAMVGGRRITVVDVHAHTFVPDVLDLVKDTPLAATAKATLTGAIALGPGTAARLAYMDKEGIDYQVINVNAWGYGADRTLARDLVRLQNEKIAPHTVSVGCSLPTGAVASQPRLDSAARRNGSRRVAGRGRIAGHRRTVSVPRSRRAGVRGRRMD